MPWDHAVGRGEAGGHTYSGLCRLPNHLSCRFWNSGFQMCPLLPLEALEGLLAAPALWAA